MLDAAAALTVTAAWVGGGTDFEYTASDCVKINFSGALDSMHHLVWEARSRKSRQARTDGQPLFCTLFKLAGK